MTARKPVSALALGLSSAVAFGFGAGQASADVNQVDQHRLVSIQGDPTPSPVLALSAVLSKTDAAVLLKQLEFSSQVKFAQILRKLPDASKLDRSKLADLAKADQAKAQIIIAAILAKQQPNLSRAQATMSAALVAALLVKSPSLAKAGLSSLPDLAAMDESEAHAAIAAFLAKLSSTSSASSLTKADASVILQAIQKTDLSKISGVADLDLSTSVSSGVDMAKEQQLVDAICAKQPSLSKASVVLALHALAQIDQSKVAVLADVDLSKVSALVSLSHVQLDAVAAAIAAQAASQQQQSPQSPASPQSPQSPASPASPQSPQYPQQPQDQAALSEADLAAAQDALSKIDPASLPDLSKVDLSKLGAPPK